MAENALFEMWVFYSNMWRLAACGRHFVFFVNFPNLLVEFMNENGNKKVDGYKVLIVSMVSYDFLSS